MFAIFLLEATAHLAALPFKGGSGLDFGLGFGAAGGQGLLDAAAARVGPRLACRAVDMARARQQPGGDSAGGPVKARLYPGARGLDRCDGRAAPFITYAFTLREHRGQGVMTRLVSSAVERFRPLTLQIDGACEEGRELER
jgi:GNAT superfamily N-acetyltransferase